MLTPPPIPPWDGLHPIIVHFPIGLLMAAPVLVILSLVLRRHERGIGIAALTLMVLGTVGAAVAVATGEAAEELVDRTDAIAGVLEQHSELAETARGIFIGLTVLYALLLLLPVLVMRFAKRDLPRSAQYAATALFLVLYGVGALVLSNVGHLGGRLVHEYGVRAMIVPDGAPAAVSAKPEHTDEKAGSEKKPD